MIIKETQFCCAIAHHIRKFVWLLLHTGFDSCSQDGISNRNRWNLAFKKPPLLTGGWFHLFCRRFDQEPHDLPCLSQRWVLCGFHFRDWTSVSPADHNSQMMGRFSPMLVPTWLSISTFIIVARKSVIWYATLADTHLPVIERSIIFCLNGLNVMQIIRPSVFDS